MTFEMMLNMCIHQQVTKYTWSCGKEILIRPDKVSRMLIDMHDNALKGNENQWVILKEFMQMANEGVEIIEVNVPRKRNPFEILHNKPDHDLYVAKIKYVNPHKKFNKFAPMRVGEVVIPSDS